MPAKTRLPGDLLWVILWLLFKGSLCLFLSSLSPKLSVRLAYGAVSALYLIPAAFLFRMRPWARWWGGLILGAGVLLTLRSILSSGFTWNRLFIGVMDAWWSIYLFLPSTRRLFQTSEGGRIDLPGCLSVVTFVVPCAILGVVANRLSLPAWAFVAAMIAYLALHVFLLENRVAKFLDARFAPRPPDLDRAAWRAFRAARRARDAGDLDRALSLAAPLPDGPSVRTFRGLVAADRARTEGGLRRVVFDASYRPNAFLRPKVADELRSADLDALVAERATLIDGLLEQPARGRSAFAEEVETAMEKLTGQVFGMNAVFRFREWWAERRPRCTGDRGRVWLFARLWEAQCLGAAAEVAGGLPDPHFREVAAVSLALEEIAGRKVGGDWVDRNLQILVLLPQLSDLLRLLYVDLPLVGGVGGGAVASRFRLRLELVSTLRRLRDDYPEDSWIEPPFLLMHLAGQPVRALRTRRAFERWWAERRESQAAFDGALASGLDAAEREDWAAAERAFAEAETAWPERSCATYNRAVALLRLERPAEAEPLFTRLSAREPGEALFHMRRGDALRLAGRPAEALQAYRETARHGGLEEEVSLRFGLLFAGEGRTEEAVRAFDAAAGKDADAQTLESLADYLESEGIYGLAAHYREEALARGFESKDEAPPDDDEDDEDRGPAGAAP